MTTSTSIYEKRDQRTSQNDKKKKEGCGTVRCSNPCWLLMIRWSVSFHPQLTSCSCWVNHVHNSAFSRKKKTGIQDIPQGSVPPELFISGGRHYPDFRRDRLLLPVLAVFIATLDVDPTGRISFFLWLQEKNQYMYAYD